MCSPARCPRCGKTTWTGCGAHVDAVLANVQPAQRCECADRAAPQTAGSDPKWGWLRR